MLESAFDPRNQPQGPKNVKYIYAQLNFIILDTISEQNHSSIMKWVAASLVKSVDSFMIQEVPERLM